MYSHIISFLLVCTYSNVKGSAQRSSTPELRCQDGHRKVFSIDNLLRPKELQGFSYLMQRQKPWIPNTPDARKVISIGLNINTSWVSPISPQLFHKLKFWKKLRGIVKQLTTRDYYPCSAMFTMTYRQDFNPVARDVEDDSGLTMRMFLNNDMEKNFYGENVFYTNNTDVMCGVHPIPGRILIWNSSISYAAKPPSMLFLQSQSSIVVKLKDSHEKYKICLDHFKEDEKGVFAESKLQEFPFTVGEQIRLLSVGRSDINFANHLTNKYFDSRGYEIAVFDDVLNKHELDILREHLIRDYFSFATQPYDTEKTEDNDNVAWISTQKVNVLVNSDLWKVIKQAVKYLSGWDEWYPYDVSMNIIRSFDHTRIHEDCEKHEYEYTFLLYLNPDWNENFYGETVFFNLVNSSKKVQPGDEEYEMVAAVRPKYGRIVLFRGIIPHSARPPSPEFRGARYTFACKVSKTYRTSCAKQLQETIEALQGFGDEDPESEELMDELMNGEHEIASEGRPRNFLETELVKQKQKLENLFKVSREFILGKL